MDRDRPIRGMTIGAPAFLSLVRANNVAIVLSRFPRFRRVVAQRRRRARGRRARRGSDRGTRARGAHGRRDVDHRRASIRGDASRVERAHPAGTVFGGDERRASGRRQTRRGGVRASLRRRGGGGPVTSRWTALETRTQVRGANAASRGALRGARGGERAQRGDAEGRRGGVHARCGHKLADVRSTIGGGCARGRRGAAAVAGTLGGTLACTGAASWAARDATKMTTSTHSPRRERSSISSSPSRTNARVEDDGAGWAE